MKKLKNLMSEELLAWAREKHGRFAQIARACGVSSRHVHAWAVHEQGIAPRHHQKIFDLVDINPVCKEYSICNCNYSVSVTGNKPVTNQQLTGQ